MQFDKTFISIRERSTLEIFDLSLHLVKRFGRNLIILMLIGSLPFIVIDLILINWLVTDFDMPHLFYWTMSMLVISQAQMGTVLISYYLGQVMFRGHAGIWETIKATLRSLVLLFWLHGCLRLVIPAALLCLMLDGLDQDQTALATLVLIPGVVFIGTIVRMIRPFISEIMLLEKPPFWAKPKGQMTFSTRSESLHGANISILTRRFFSSAAVAVGMAFSLFSVFLIVDSVLNLRANTDIYVSHYYFTVSLWITANFIAVQRFLSYIDVRIRQEGWAVELKMRAASRRMLGLE
ncbi:MAG: hypothetical protein AAF623_06605 [Planctomycetota bacterium]